MRPFSLVFLEPSKSSWRDPVRNRLLSELGVVDLGVGRVTVTEIAARFFPNDAHLQTIHFDRNGLPADVVSRGSGRMVGYFEVVRPLICRPTARRCQPDSRDTGFGSPKATSGQE